MAEYSGWQVYFESKVRHKVQLTTIQDASPDHSGSILYHIERIWEFSAVHIMGLWTFMQAFDHQQCATGTGFHQTFFIVYSPSGSRNVPLCAVQSETVLHSQRHFGWTLNPKPRCIQAPSDINKCRRTRLLVSENRLTGGQALSSHEHHLTMVCQTLVHHKPHELDHA